MAPAGCCRCLPPRHCRICRQRQPQERLQPSACPSAPCRPMPLSFSSPSFSRFFLLISAARRCRRHRPEKPSAAIPPASLMPAPARRASQKPQTDAWRTAAVQPEPDVPLLPQRWLERRQSQAEVRRALEGAEEPRTRITRGEQRRVTASVVSPARASRMEVETNQRRTFRLQSASGTIAVAR